MQSEQLSAFIQILLCVSLDTLLQIHFEDDKINESNACVESNMTLKRKRTADDANEASDTSKKAIASGVFIDLSLRSKSRAAASAAGSNANDSASEESNTVYANFDDSTCM